MQKMMTSPSSPTIRDKLEALGFAVKGNDIDDHLHAALDELAEYRKRVRSLAENVLGKAEQGLSVQRADIPMDGEYSLEDDSDTRGGWTLYYGRSDMHHGYNLCTLSDFDFRGEETRRLILEALNGKP